MPDPHRLDPRTPRLLRTTIFRDGRLFLPERLSEGVPRWLIAALIILPLLGLFVGWLSVQLGY